MNTNLSEIERAKISFEKSFECKIESIDKVEEFVSIKSSCKDKEIVVNYDFLSFDVPVAEYEIDCQGPCLEFGKYFVFPPLEEIGEVIFIKEKIHQTPKALIYKVGDRLVNVGVDEIINKITWFWSKSEGFYYGIYYE